MVTRQKAFYLNDSGDINPEAWLDHVAVQRPEGRLRLIRHAVALTRLTGLHYHTPLGVSCLQNGLLMADLLLDLMMDEDTICAALLYSTVCYAELDLKLVEEQINTHVTRLLKGALRMNSISHFVEHQHLKQNQLENFRKMLFAMADDMRIVPLKLSERIAWMRTIKRYNIRTVSSRAYAREAITVYASLANRLGIHSLRYELEDLAMEQLAPRLYRKMTVSLKEPFLDREAYIKELVLAIEIALSKIGISQFKVTSRVKNFYGTYRKMRYKKVGVEKIYDLNALRVIVQTVEDCYRVASVIQALWTPVADGFDDYIKNPKDNDYRSIHMAIHGANDKIVEVQVRTFEMDQASEANHWEYKEGLLHKPNYQSKIAWLRQVITWQKELVKSGMYLTPELTTMLDDRVYVLTESSDIIELPKGATALDFAYYMHAEMGHYCHYVEVDRASQPLTYVLQTGEQIQVFTGNQLMVNWDWLNPDFGYLYTTQARAKVLHWFQQKNYRQDIAMGQLLLEKGYRQLGISPVNQDKLAHQLQFKSRQELLAALGSGELRIVEVFPVLNVYRKQQRLSHAVPSYKLGEPSEVYRTHDRVTTKLVVRGRNNRLIPILQLLKREQKTVVSVAAKVQDNGLDMVITLCLAQEALSDTKRLVPALRKIPDITAVEINLV